MASPYDVSIIDGSGLIRLEGTADFPSTNAPAPIAAPTFTGVVTLPATVAAPLPTADPHIAGRLWANSGVVTVSAG